MEMVYIESGNREGRSSTTRDIVYGVVRSPVTGEVASDTLSCFSRAQGISLSCHVSFPFLSLCLLGNLLINNLASSVF